MDKHVTDSGGAAATATAASPPFTLRTSPGFVAWLSENRCSIAVTAHQVGKLFFFGAKPDGSLWVFNRNLGRCQGMAADGASLWVATDGQILKFADAMADGANPPGEAHDALYVPRAAFFTGDVDAHEMAAGPDGLPVFVNTLFSCLSAPGLQRSFDVLWKPPFITELAPEDRCHLNGLAFQDGAPAYVSLIAASNLRDGWRDKRDGGGQVIDVRSGEVVCEGLSMPHSPRWHADRLWLHNSGTGEFGCLDAARGRFEAVAFCPGYLRGLSFTGAFAVAGLSKPRGSRTASGLPLDATLARHKADPVCGLRVIDTGSGAIVHGLDIEGLVDEIFDVALLPGRLRPAAIRPGSQEARRMIVI